MNAIRESFIRGLPFALDEYQVRAIDSIDEGASVVVAAPTGSGKTVVAEYAIHKALNEGRKAFYTAPIKALSNQKYADLVAQHGSENVGLLTGDAAINPTAPVLVMTTEVLRNMIYAKSPALEGLRYVVLDEVHYLQVAYRGSVWEEVIIHTPLDVDLVCLSATVSNAEELAAWVTSVRGRTTAIIHEHRPITLTHLYLVGNRDSGEVTMLPTFVDGRPNPAAYRLDTGPYGANPPRSGRSRTQTPRRIEVVESLRRDAMLPAIYFLFSRAGCDDAVGECLRSPLRLTSPQERRAIEEIVESKMRALDDGDLRVLGFERFSAALQRGFAAHHAGIVPPFKEAVEACFAAGLIKVVFATETLALGINMPARTVVIEKLSKFNGDRHESLTAGEYTQLTGRAGRRGIDTNGYAAALWTPFVAFEQVAGLAARRTYELRSSFRPTSNMAVNLVRRYGPKEAHHLLSLSFAQYRIDAELVSLRARSHRLQLELDEANRKATCERGEVGVYVAARQRERPSVAAPGAVAKAFESLRPGDVLGPLGPSGAVGTRKRRDGRGGRTSGSAGTGSAFSSSHQADDEWLVVVGTVARRRHDPQLRAVTLGAALVTLTPGDFRSLPTAVTHIRLPAPFNPNSRTFQHAAANALRIAMRTQTEPRVDDDRARRTRNPRRDADRPTGSLEIARLESCPDLASHVEAWERAQRLGHEIRALSTRALERGNSLTDQFDHVLVLLEDLGYLDGWAVTNAGTMLAGLYHEADLLICECLRSGALDGLSPPLLAGLVSGFVYETRGPGSPKRRSTTPDTADESHSAQAHGPRHAKPPPVGLPLGFPRTLTGRWRTILAIADDLAGREAAGGLPPSRGVDPGFVEIAAAWASGAPLEEVLLGAEITGGDFVRTIRGLVDLLRQIAQVATVSQTARAARVAADLLSRGVILAASIPSGTDRPDAPNNPYVRDSPSAGTSGGPTSI